MMKLAIYYFTMRKYTHTHKNCTVQISRYLFEYEKVPNPSDYQWEQKIHSSHGIFYDI